MDNSFIIMSAPNGARRQKSDHPAIPITPSEMAQCAEEILDAGASLLHLHVRDDKGCHSLDVEQYKKSISAIRSTIGDKLIIQATTEAVGIYNRYEQMDMVRSLRPEAVSLALRELCPDENSVPEFDEFNRWLQDENIFPQYIIYNIEDYQRFENYVKRGIFYNDNPFILFVFGSYQSTTSKEVLDSLKHVSIDTDKTWAVCGFADNERECVQHAAKNNGHIRVGFENNILNIDNQLLENNAEMVRYASKIAHIEERTVANAYDIRSKFKLRD